MLQRVVFLLAALFAITASGFRKTCSQLRGTSVVGFLAGRVVTGNFNGTPVDLHFQFQHGYSKRRLIKPKDFSRSAKLFLGYDGDVFVVKYLLPRHTFNSEERLYVVEGPGLATVEGIFRFNLTLTRRSIQAKNNYSRISTTPDLIELLESSSSRSSTPQSSTTERNGSTWIRKKSRTEWPTLAIPLLTPSLTLFPGRSMKTTPKIETRRS
ncbi:hypothetical protein L596_012459 [Steinernema carpocapsae]|uniref:Uncharacterized protein n=1 Tax=Steinernema carpocapsae TaxID=34508 RepID=A0A4U5NY04_STECR|nr:hypothetical protein L596_012459 [Steinernema carpocapsae]